MGIPIEKLPYELQQKIKRQAAAPDPYAYRTNSQSVAGMGSPEPQHREVQTLAGSIPKQTGRQECDRRCRVLIVRYGRKALDDDNLMAAYKAARDRIAECLGIDDGDPRVQWDYDQVVGKTNGTHVLITMIAPAKGQTGTKGI